MTIQGGAQEAIRWRRRWSYKRMTEYIITYDSGEKEVVRGYNIIMALSGAKKGLDNIKSIEKIWN
jgi:hypothetical protein